MFKYLCLYAQNMRVKLELTHLNSKIFCMVADADCGLSVDLTELNQLFENHWLTILAGNFGQILADNAFANAEPKKIALQFEVLEDLDEYGQLMQKDIESDLKKGEIRNFVLNDGESLSFGKDPYACDAVLSQEDVSNVQFTLKNMGGTALMID